ncbi:MAG TPA: signal peptidase II [bacterium]|nr:signal peptidase II [bacterium]
MQKSIAKKLNRLSKIPKTALFWAVLLLASDRFLKILALVYWSNHSTKLWPGWSLTYSLNHKIAFSLPWSGLSLLFGLTIVTLILTFIAIRQIKKQPAQSWGWSLFLTGTYSNLFDRFIYGGVIDYLANWWTIFNLADVLIIIGLSAILLSSNHSRQHQPELPA